MSTSTKDLNWPRGLSKEEVQAISPIGPPVKPPPPEQNVFPFGTRVNLNGKIFVLDGGLLRWIPDPPTYNSLFANWNGILTYAEDHFVTSLHQGPQLPSGAYLAKAVAFPQVYLVENNVKRWIVSPDVMTAYDFGWNLIYQVPPGYLNGLASGAAVVTGTVIVPKT